MSTSLPASPSLEQLRRQAKDLLRAHRAGHEAARSRVASRGCTGRACVQRAAAGRAAAPRSPRAPGARTRRKPPCRSAGRPATSRPRPPGVHRVAHDEVVGGRRPGSPEKRLTARSNEPHQALTGSSGRGTERGTRRAPAPPRSRRRSSSRPGRSRSGRARCPRRAAPSRGPPAVRVDLAGPASSPAAASSSRVTSPTAAVGVSGRCAGRRRWLRPPPGACAGRGRRPERAAAVRSRQRRRLPAARASASAPRAGAAARAGPARGELAEHLRVGVQRVAGLAPLRVGTCRPRADRPSDAGRAAPGFYRPHSGFPAWQPSDHSEEVRDEALAWAARNDRVEALDLLVARGAALEADVYRGTALSGCGLRLRRRGPATRGARRRPQRAHNVRRARPRARASRRFTSPPRTATST